MFFDTYHSYGVGHAALSGLSLSQHLFHASRTAGLFTLHQPGRIVSASAQSFTVLATSPSEPSITVCTLSNCFWTPFGPSISGWMWRSFWATRLLSCTIARRCASSEVPVTASISLAMSPSAFCDAWIRATVEVAMGAIWELMIGCEKAVEVAILRAAPVGHVCWPVVGSIVHAPANDVQVLSAASGPLQTWRSGFPSF